MKKKQVKEHKPVGAGALCKQCGRGVEVVEGYFIEHRVKGVTSQVVKICSGSLTLAEHVVT